MTNRGKTRRGVLASLAGLAGGVLFGGRAVAGVRTPRAAEGPFYPTPRMRFADIDNDLVKIAGMVRRAGGEVITLKGRVADGRGAPRPGLRVEIWQCDTGGRYLHPGDRGAAPRDRAFQGYGHDITGADGGFRFRTIKPVKYPGRAPHIHVKVLDGARELLTTQFYIAGHPDNAGDVLFRRMSPDQAEAVAMVFTDGRDGPETVVDIVL